MKLRALLWCLAAWTALPAAHALACSPRGCSVSSVFPASGSVPANMVQLLFMPGRSYNDADAGTAEPRLYRLEGETRVSVAFSTRAESVALWIIPSESLPAGTRLVLEATPGPCDDTPYRAELSVGEAQPLPTLLGTLAVQTQRGPLDVSVTNGSCTGTIDASYADLTVQLSPTASPYAALLRHRLFVDDAERPPFSSSLGGGIVLPQGQARIFASCDAKPMYSPSGPPLAPGIHRVRMTSTLPDGTSLSTPELEVDLRCAAPSTPIWDAGAPLRDAGLRGVDAAMTLRRVDASVSDAESSDEGCALGMRGDGGSLLALALFLLRRRTR